MLGIKSRCGNMKDKCPTSCALALVPELVILKIFLCLCLCLSLRRGLFLILAHFMCFFEYSHVYYWHFLMTFKTKCKHEYIRINFNMYNLLFSLQVKIQLTWGLFICSHYSQIVVWVYYPEKTFNYSSRRITCVHFGLIGIRIYKAFSSGKKI